MSHESRNANFWEYLMNLPFILDLTISQHPFITEELQRITVRHSKYNRTCHMSMAHLSYVRLEGHTVLLCWFRSSGMWSYVLRQAVLSVLKAVQSFETLVPLAQWYSILSQKTWTLMSQSGGFVKKQMVLQFLTDSYSCFSNQYQCNTPQTMITEGLL